MIPSKTLIPSINAIKTQNIAKNSTKVNNSSISSPSLRLLDKSRASNSSVGPSANSPLKIHPQQEITTPLSRPSVHSELQSTQNSLIVSQNPPMEPMKQIITSRSGFTVLKMPLFQIFSFRKTLKLKILFIISSILMPIILLLLSKYASSKCFSHLFSR